LALTYNYHKQTLFISALNHHKKLIHWFINITTSYFIPIFYYTQNKNIYSWHFCLLLFSKLYHFIGTRFVDPPFNFFNSSLLWDVFIINSVKQLQTWPKTQSEINISPFLKTQKPSSRGSRVFVSLEMGLYRSRIEFLVMFEVV
jgi:hypothetical protein